jgi:hypothetical protein
MMKSTTRTALFLTAAAMLAGALLVSGRSAESSAMDGIGRFQIVTGWHHGAIGSGPANKGDVYVNRMSAFKIDTVTGETWILNERINTQSVISNDYEREWERIE